MGLISTVFSAESPFESFERARRGSSYSELLVNEKCLEKRPLECHRGLAPWGWHFRP